MGAQDIRALAQRCRDLLRIAVRSDVKDQLRLWVEDFDKTEAMEGKRARPARAKTAEG